MARGSQSESTTSVTSPLPGSIERKRGPIRGSFRLVVCPDSRNSISIDRPSADAGLQHLEELTDLTTLYVGDTQVTDAGLVAV